MSDPKKHERLIKGLELALSLLKSGKKIEVKTTHHMNDGWCRWNGYWESLFNYCFKGDDFVRLKKEPGKVYAVEFSDGTTTRPTNILGDAEYSLGKYSDAVRLISYVQEDEDQNNGQ